MRSERKKQIYLRFSEPRGRKAHAVGLKRKAGNAPYYPHYPYYPYFRLRLDHPRSSESEKKLRLDHPRSSW